MIDLMRREPSCLVQPPSGQPVLADAGHGIPDDLREFYDACGGAELFITAPFAWSICEPRRLVPTNPEVVGEQVPDDITASWYIVGRERGDSTSLISIDLGTGKRGWTYDSNFEVHGVAGSCAVLAHSFTDLLDKLLAARGEYLFWTVDSFVSLGDAYD
jgi:hypothetical protein